MPSIRLIALCCVLHLSNAIAGTGATPPSISLANIAGQSKAAVEKTIGNPDSCEQSKYGERCYYQSGNIEVVFINALADWITYYNKIDLPYQAKTIELIGFDATNPTNENDSSIGWTNIKSVKSVQFFPGEGGNIDYIYIKTNTN